MFTAIAIMAHCLLFLSDAGTATRVPTATIPAVHFQYADPSDGWDTYPYGTPIRLTLPLSDLAKLSNPLVRLFAARFIADATEPGSLALAKVNSCGFFQWRPVAFSPTPASPEILIGQLPDSDFRCVNRELADTDFYIVIEENGQVTSPLRIDLAAVDAYFRYSYKFTVEVPKHHPCLTGTEASDRADWEAKRRNPRRWAAARRRSLEARQALYVADVKVDCIEAVRERTVDNGINSGASVETAAGDDGACPPIGLPTESVALDQPSDSADEALLRWR